MTVYYDDLVFTGPYFQPAVWGGHATPAYADDLVYQPPITSVATQIPVSVNFVGSGVFAPVTSTPLSAFVAFAGSGVFAPVAPSQVTASVSFVGAGVFAPVRFLGARQVFVAFAATGLLTINGPPGCFEGVTGTISNRLYRVASISNAEVSVTGTISNDAVTTNAELC